ncbi:MAG: hypothetical protein K0M45_04620 [Candidatus Paracaedibacteraceae bacterium]|nr:hypothetical protein [Candidatus Paracaedibacteraceae bacterium]
MKLRDFSRLIINEDGQSLVETSLIYLLIAIAITISLVAFGKSLLGQYLDSVAKINEATKQ